MGTSLLSRLVVCIVILVIYSEYGNGQQNSPQNQTYSTCKVYTERLGCYKDSVLPSRPLPELLFTDRDTTSPAYTGGFIDLKNWNLYMEDLRCRCAEESKAKGYNVFGLQFYGECWSGPTANKTYNQNGESDKCVTHDLAHCTTFEEDCVGRDYTNFVYEIRETPVVNHTHNTTHHLNMTHIKAENITITHHTHTIIKNTTTPPPTIPPTDQPHTEVPGYVPSCHPHCLPPPAPPAPPQPCPIAPCQVQPWFIYYKDQAKKPKAIKLWNRIFGSTKEPNRAGKLISYLINAFKRDK